MAYRRSFYRQSKPTPRNLSVKYPAPCVCCGATIKAGEWATYYPAGTIAGISEGKIAHCGGLDGNSRKCSDEIAKRYQVKDAGLNDYAGDGLDARYEDDCASRCGL